MNNLGLDPSILSTYTIAAAIMIIKAAMMSWFTVLRMMQEKGGYRAPEDLKKTPLNPNPAPKQLDPHDRVERIRRIHLNDLENIPFFLAAGFLFILTDPSLLLTQCLLYGYVASRLLHFIVYLTGQIHDLRAAMWTPGSLIILYMAGHALVVAAST